MARLELDREDLFAEAGSMEPRFELRGVPLPDGTIREHAIVVGLRGGSVSLFDGTSVVDHFDDSGRWRRGFRQGTLLKAERGRPVEMRRVRMGRQVRLEATVLTDAERDLFLADVERRISDLARNWHRLRTQVTRRFPEGDAEQEAAAWGRALLAISRIQVPIQVADKPGLR